MSRTVSPARRGSSSARAVAVDILVRVERLGAFANLLLHHAIGDARLSAADAALVTELVLGVLRHRTRVDWTLTGASSHGLDEIPAPIRAILRTGAYQLLFLSRVPPRAAVSEAVDLAKRHGHAGTAALVNAVLRRLATSGERPLPPPDDPATRIEVEHSHPAWLVRGWLDRFGPDETEALCRANNLPAPRYARANLLRGSPDAMLTRLHESGLTVLPTPLPEGVEVRGAFGERHRLVEEGVLTVQDLGAMLVTRVLDPQPGETIIDACAAPGGKTTHIAERMGDRGRVIACDIHAGKLALTARRAAVVGAGTIEPHLQDARGLGRAFPQLADRVLVDAPCTGLGVVRRRPDIKWRVQPAHVETLARLQLQILTGAAGAVRPGGTLVYSVCTTEPEEGESVIRNFLQHHPRFSLQPFPPLPPDLGSEEDSGMMSVWPHRQGTDGFFIARLRSADAR
ncbi:MAG TPA: 16S rRNA (cytosine(967)-C(5))-methyltransferase RsmB [bacterium]|jgi:16S rRNA (cytosine967-C5)-methyltransferase